jgi:superfamily I DNA/RNA helicase
MAANGHLICAMRSLVAHNRPPSQALARTFHSLAFSILSEKLRPEDPTCILISGAEQDAYIKDLLSNDHVEIDWHGDLRSSA